MRVRVGLAFGLRLRAIDNIDEEVDFGGDTRDLLFFQDLVSEAGE